MSADVERESISDEANRIIEEARMVLPGIQALFGFQLIAVFSQRFDQLTDAQRLVHLAALFAVALGIALIMTPAVYHRQAEPGMVSRYFIRMASRCLTTAAIPLLIGIVLDFYLVATLLAQREHLNVVLTIVVVAAFTGLWFVFPWWRRLQHGRRRYR
jgi:hypothetical protein